VNKALVPVLRADIIVVDLSRPRDYPDGGAMGHRIAVESARSAR